MSCLSQNHMFYLHVDSRRFSGQQTSWSSIMPAGRVITELESKLAHLLSGKLVLIGCTGVGNLPVFLTVSSTQIVFSGSKTLSSTPHTVWRKSLTDSKGHYHFNGFCPHPYGSCHHFHDTHHYRYAQLFPLGLEGHHIPPACDTSVCAISYPNPC